MTPRTPSTPLWPQCREWVIFLLAPEPQPRHVAGDTPAELMPRRPDHTPDARLVLAAAKAPLRTCVSRPIDGEIAAAAPYGRLERA